MWGSRRSQKNFLSLKFLLLILVLGNLQKSAFTEITTFASFRPTSPQTTPSQSQRIKIIIYIHDWNTWKLDKSFEVKAALLKNRKDVKNVIIADWSTFSQSPDYYSVAERYTPKVAQDVKAEIGRVLELDSEDAKDIECIGHGLGAHVCGQVGKLWNSDQNGEQKLGKIIALDPTGPYFKSHPREALGKGDATTVECWHTDKRFGTYSDIGDTNFYPKTEDEIMACSKNRLLKRNQCLHKAAVDMFLRKLEMNPRPPNNNSSSSGESPMSILALDVSPSMKNHERIQNMIAAAKRLINSLPTGYLIGIVIFGGEAQINLLPVNITDDEASRKLIISKLPGVNTEIANTSIGAGVSKAFDVAQPFLKSGAFCPDIILVTDGEENKEPFIRNVQPRLTGSCSKVHTIALGNDADFGIESLSVMSRGQVYFASDVNSLDKLTQSLVASSTDQFRRNAQPINLPPKTVNLDSPASASFQLDEGLVGGNATFMVSTPNPAGLMAELIAPNGDEYSKNYTVDTDLHQLLFKLLEVQAGNWTIKLNSGEVSAARKRRAVETQNNNQTATIFVTSYPSEDGAQPIRLEAFLSGRILDYKGNPISIEAHVYRGNDAILGARVQAEIHAPDGTKVVMELFDNGAGADEEKDDGVYTRFVSLGLIPKSRYQVEVRATSASDGSTKIRSGDGDPFRLSDNDILPLSYKFEREATAGSFRVASDWQYGPIPPISIKNLEAISVDETSRLVTVKWTASGESDLGTPDPIQLKAFSRNRYLNESQSFVFSSAQVKSGSLTPEPGGSSQNVTVEIPESLWEEGRNGSDTQVNLYFVIRSGSDLSAISNVAPVEFAMPLEANNNYGTVLAVSITLAVLLVAGILALIYLRHRMRNFKVQQSLKNEDEDAQF